MIPFFDYRRELERLRAPMEQALRRVLDSGQLILGPEVQAFEQEFAAYTGANHAIGVNSGTDALILALRALGVRSGDAVLTVANAGAPTVAAIRATGARPRFIDVDPRTLLIDPSRLDSAWHDDVKAIVPVHLYGQAASLKPILEFAAERGVAVVEDCAQSHGAYYEDRHTGRWGRVGCFSFYPTKNLGAYGDGGMLITDDPALAAELRRQRMYGFDGARVSSTEGLNSRLDEMQAAVLRIKLAHYDDALAQRRRLAGRYRAALAEASGLRLVHAGTDRSHAYHLWVVQVADRDAVRRRLSDAGVASGIHYEQAVHHMPAYRFLDPGDNSLAVSERACAEVLSLPLFGGMRDDELDQVCDTVAAVCER